MSHLKQFFLFLSFLLNLYINHSSGSKFYEAPLLAFRVSGSKLSKIYLNCVPACGEAGCRCLPAKARHAAYCQLVLDPELLPVTFELLPSVRL